MKTVMAAYDFVTGGSIVTPIGLVVAIGCARFGAVALLAAVAMTLIASTFERP